MPQAPKSSRPQHPLPEYPRPALRRDSFESLNGVWQYAITKSAKLPPQWDGDILVPYSPEAKASGNFLLHLIVCRRRPRTYDPPQIVSSGYRSVNH